MKKLITLMMATAIMLCAADSCAAEVEKENTALVPVEHVEMEELSSSLDGEQEKSSPSLHEVFNDCFDNDNARACQKLFALAAEATSMERSVLSLERAMLHAIIAAQQDTITTHERTIDSFNKIHERKSARRGAKRTPRSYDHGMTCEPKPIKKSLSDNS
jgi:hypothetical protein